jgi:ABC-type Fe3+/spermidine/putrescine transport system ATPase subunit
MSLYNLFDLAETGGNIYIRPEKIGVGQDSAKGIAGAVMEVKFLGAHHRLLIRTNEMDLIAYVENAPSINDEVYVYSK